MSAPTEHLTALGSFAELEADHLRFAWGPVEASNHQAIVGHL